MEKLKNSQKLLTNIEIKTKRLLLKPISMENKEDIFKEFTDEVSVFMIPRPVKNISETESFIETSLRGLENGSDLQLVVLKNKSKEFLNRLRFLKGEGRKYHQNLIKITIGEIESLIKNRTTLSKKEIKIEVTEKKIKELEEALSREGTRIWIT